MIRPSRRLLVAAALIALAGAPGASAAPGPAYDLVIRDALIVDGTGAPAYRGDVAVTDGRLTVVGVLPAGASASRTIEAAGRVVSPGFIDNHAHGDPLVNRSFENFVSQGVTTIVLGQDGETPGYEPPDSDTESQDLASWAYRATAATLDINVAALSGHGSLRWEAGVGLAAVPTPEQMIRMKALLQRDLDAGAFGLSSGLEYAPGLYAGTEELLELAQVVGANSGVIMSHLRSEDDDKIDAALDELFAQGRYAPVHVSHLKVVLGRGAARGEAILARMRAARADGVRVSGDVYPYLAGFADISLVYPPWAKTRAQYDAAMATRRDEFEAFVRARIDLRNGPGAILIADGPMAGLTLEEAASRAGKPYWIYAVEDMTLGSPSAAHFVQDGPLQDVFLTSSLISISTDGAPWMRHPRSWGTYARVIEDYVVRRRAMTLEQAIFKMTGLAADNVGILDRGRLRPGLAADLVMFDPVRVRSNATWTDPRARSDGFDLVVINGVPVFDDGVMTGARSGRILRRGDR